jgi:hypothetical protein
MAISRMSRWSTKDNAMHQFSKNMRGGADVALNFHRTPPEAIHRDEPCDACRSDGAAC